jgi:hypothetical protein
MCQKKLDCRNSGSNQGPLDLQSNALQTELFRHILKRKNTYFFKLFPIILYNECAMIVIKTNIIDDISFVITKNCK